MLDPKGGTSLVLCAQSTDEQELATFVTQPTSNFAYLGYKYKSSQIINKILIF